MSERMREAVEAARDALFAVEELLPMGDHDRARLYALRVQYTQAALPLITRGEGRRCSECGYVGDLDYGHIRPNSRTCPNTNKVARGLSLR